MKSTYDTRQLLRDFDKFARTMRLQYICPEKKLKSTSSMSNQIGNHQCNSLTSLSPSQTPIVCRSPSLARLFDGLLPQVTNRGKINELIEQANRHHPTTLSFAEAPVLKRKINATARGTMGRLRFLSPLPSLLVAQRGFCEVERPYH